MDVQSWEETQFVAEANLEGVVIRQDDIGTIRHTSITKILSYTSLKLKE